jgi:hypothetical protein
MFVGSTQRHLIAQTLTIFCLPLCFFTSLAQAQTEPPLKPCQTLILDDQTLAPIGGGNLKQETEGLTLDLDCSLPKVTIMEGDTDPKTSSPVVAVADKDMKRLFEEARIGLFGKYEDLSNLPPTLGTQEGYGEKPNFGYASAGAEIHLGSRRRVILGIGALKFIYVQDLMKQPLVDIAKSLKDWDGINVYVKMKFGRPRRE